MSKKQINVLIDDDESAIREMTRFALRNSGMKIRVAADSRENPFHH